MKKIFSIIILFAYLVIFALFITQILPRPYSMILAALNGIISGVVLEKIINK